MTDAEKYREEKAVIAAFRKLYTVFPKGRLIKSESPDFILKMKLKKAIGIELVQLIFNNEDPDSMVEKLNILLGKKEEKLRLYRKKRLNLYWLIVYITFHEEGVTRKLINKLSNIPVNSSFNAVFLFEQKRGQIHELLSTR